MIVRINKANQKKIKKLMLSNKEISNLINTLLDIVTNSLLNVTKVSPMDKVTNNEENVTNTPNKNTNINKLDIY